MADETTEFRLNQAIAKTGRCSRRQADQLIAAGRVKVNGRVVTDYNFKVSAALDDLAIDGQKLEIQSFIYLVMYKPAGIVTTCKDEQGRKSILDLLPAKLGHVRPVGRLDMYSEGLILLSNDGSLTQKVTHPLYHLPKRYVVTVKDAISDSCLRQMAKGVELEDGLTQEAEVKLIKRNRESSEFELTIREGRNRQIRRMCEALGHRVSRLVRVGIGGLQLGVMTPGSWRYLTGSELKQLGCG